MVVLQVLCHYEFMIEMDPLMSENQVKKSLSYVMSPHLTQLGEGALQLWNVAYFESKRGQVPERSDNTTLQAYPFC